MAKKSNGFKGKVLTHLEYIREKQDKFEEEIKDIRKEVNENNEKTEKIKYAVGVALGWLGGLTAALVKRFFL